MNNLLKKVLLLAVAVLLMQTLNAQRTFSKMYDLLGVWESASSVLFYGNDYMILSGRGKNFGVTDSTKYRKVYIWKIDSNQQAIVTNIFGSNFYDYTGLVALKPPTDKFNLAIIVNNDSTEYRILGIDSTGRVIKSYSIDAPFDFASITWLLRGSKIYIWGIDATNKGTLSPMRVLCVDTTGKQVWYKIYDKAFNVVNAIPMGTSHFLVSGYYVKGNTQNDTAVGWYAQMDTIGTIVWEKLLDKKDVYEATNVVTASLNGRYYIASSNDGSDWRFPDPVRDTSFLYMYQIDEQGNPLWFKRTYTSPWSKLVAAWNYTEKNGYMYATGNLETTEGWAGSTTYLTLLKFDSAGNMLWQRLFKQWYRDNRPYSLTPVYDGFIICADGKDTTHTTGQTDAWVIKTDTNGCVIPGCHLKDGLIQVVNPEAFLEVYPNPATDKVYIESTDAKALLQNIMIYNANGTKLMEQATANTKQHILNTTALAKGTYYLVIELKTGERAVKKLIIVHH